MQEPLVGIFVVQYLIQLPFLQARGNESCACLLLPLQQKEKVLQLFHHEQHMANYVMYKSVLEH
jgi:hypothetical protein